MFDRSRARMIVRTWRGATRAVDADPYLEYLHRTGFAGYRETPGNLGVLGLRRIREGRAEFFLITLWDSAEAVRGFAGEHPERAVFYPEDDRFLVERDEYVDHYEVVYAHGVGTGGEGAAAQGGATAGGAAAGAGTSAHETAAPGTARRRGSRLVRRALEWWSTHVQHAAGERGGWPPSGVRAAL